MKKYQSVLCLILAFCLMAFPAAAMAEENTDTLVNWNIRIIVPEGAKAVLQGDEYYIYAQAEGAIPYVLVRTYRYDDPVAFLDDFTAYMQQQYPDLKVTADIARKTFGDKKCFETDYSYQVSGYEVRDRRIALTVGGTTYMFASKEVEELGMTIGTMLDDVVADCVFLSADDMGENAEFAPGYLYCQEDGMPKYWLDFTGTMEENLILHCYFRSSDPTFYESWYVLDLASAEATDQGVHIRQVRDQYGLDHSDWFRELTLQFYLDGVVMTVERDETTLAGGTEDNILDGTYVMLPVGVSVDSTEKTSHICPASDGPYQPEELGAWAQFYYFRNSGFFPPKAEITENDDGTFTIHLFEVTETDGIEHTATSAWYTVDGYGEGKNDITEEPISLMK